MIEQLAFHEARRSPEETRLLMSTRDGRVILASKLDVLQQLKTSGFTRDSLKDLHVKQTTAIEKELSKSLAVYFAESADRIIGGLDFSSVDPNPEQADVQGTKLVNEAFDFDLEIEELDKAVRPILAEAILRGIVSEVTLVREATKATTAEEFASRYGINELDGFSIGDMPQWMLDAANDSLEEILAQDYWQEIPVTTREDIKDTLVDAIRDGLSIREIANRLVGAHGSDYTDSRARTVARTETSSMLNAGHNAAINHLNDEVPFEIGKEWLSVLGTTTRPSHAAKDGTTVKADEDFTLNGVDVPYPAHHDLPAKDRANCQCTIISDFIGADLTEEESTEQSGRADEGEVAVVADRGVEQVIEDTSKSIQGLSHERLVVLDEKGNEIFSKDGDAESVDIPESDAKKMRDAITVHNHPMVNGAVTSFSGTDIVGALARGEKETHIITQQGHRFKMSYEGVKGSRTKLAGKVAKDYEGELKKQGKLWAAKVVKGDSTVNEALLKISHESWQVVAEKNGLTYESLGVEP